MRAVAIMLCALAAVSCGPEKRPEPPPAAPVTEPVAREAEYRGWQSLEMANGLIAVQIVPGIGGRVMQFSLSGEDYFWVNDALAGQIPPAGGLGTDGSWLNYGGEKLWPAPQGPGRDDRRPGPPDAVFDGSPHQGRIVTPGGSEASVELVSRDDPRSGIRFSRLLKLFPNSTRVSIDATMKNIGTQPRRWGICSIAQIDAESLQGGPNRSLAAYAPINPQSIYPDGYRTIAGVVGNPQFKPDYSSDLMQVRYRHIVGKIGLDSHAGWLAAVDGERGIVFAERFTWHKDREYPDGASVEVWTQGLGELPSGDTLKPMPSGPASNPWLIETELLSPLARLKPGESYTFHYDWFAARIGGSHRVLSCNDAGVVCEPLRATLAAGKLLLTGRFGVFHKGSATLVLLDADGKKLPGPDITLPITPLQPLTGQALTGLAADVSIPSKARQVELTILTASGEPAGSLGQTAIQR